MSSNVSAALRLELQPSRQRRIWRWLTHLVVISSLPMLQSPWLMSAVAVIIGLSLYRSRFDQRIILLWHSDDQWTLFENGGQYAVILAHNPFVQPWLVILSLRVAEQRRARYIAIFSDMLSPQSYRRLRVRLRRRPSELEAVSNKLKMHNI